MTYTRKMAEDYLADRFDSLFEETGLLAVDDRGGMKIPLDRAFSDSGVLYADLRTATVDDTKGAALEALLDYHMLERFLNSLATAVNFEVAEPGLRRNSSTVYDHVKDLLARAEAKLDALGITVAAGDSVMSSGRLLLDYVEPDPSPDYYGYEVVP